MSYRQRHHRSDGVIDVDIQSLGAKARVIVLLNTPAVLSIGRLIEDHECTFK